MEQHTVYLGLGSNMGNCTEKLNQACEKIEKLVGHIVRQSAYYETEPWGFESDHSFLNADSCCASRSALNASWDGGRRLDLTVFTMTGPSTLTSCSTTIST